MKRAGKHSMLTALILLLWSVPTICREDVYDYVTRHPKMDKSAAKACYVLNGNVQQVDLNDVSKGFTCEYTAQVFTGDDEGAMSFCESRTAFPIETAKRKMISNFPYVTCKFKVNLLCKDGWYQMHGICYKVVKNPRMTFKQAKAFCKTLESKEFEPKLAEFYSSSLGLYFNDLYFSEVWVTVPDLKSYFVNGDGEAGLFVLDGAFKWDTKVGTLIMEDTETLHPAMCQYKPPMTIAQMYHLAKQYNTIYPFQTTHSGVTLATSSYMTINQNDLVDGKKAGERLPKFDTDQIRDRCRSLGKILNVESFPLASIQPEWNAVHEELTDHRFYLTSAYKNDGCSVTSYVDYDQGAKIDVPVYRTEEKTNENVCQAFSFTFSQWKRHASKAAMRAPALCTLHSFGFKYADCPPGWVQFDRKGGSRFCHWINNDIPVKVHDARDACAKMKASLSGFESAEEFEKVKEKVNPNTNNGLAYDSHYWLGGVIPCATDCQGKYIASWDDGVSKNTEFLNKFNHYGYTWGEKGNDVIAFRADAVAFHTHNHLDPYDHMWYICGRYADLIPMKNDNITLVNQ